MSFDHAFFVLFFKSLTSEINFFILSQIHNMKELFYQLNMEKWYFSVFYLQACISIGNLLHIA